MDLEAMQHHAGGKVIEQSRSNPSLPLVDHSDEDSAIGTFTVERSTASLRSSIYQNVEENGRTYHHYKQGQYNLPNDEKEMERLDLQHTLFYITLGEKLFLAPIKSDIHSVLDIATGTGIWALEFATMFPATEVIGTDLSPIQPLHVPANCRFEIDDAEEEWNFAQRFDFIHGRALLTCFKDPRTMMREALKSLAPGGYLELQDVQWPFNYVGEPPLHSDLYRWGSLTLEGSQKLGRPWNNVIHNKSWMEEVGFEDVVEKKFYFPVGTWAKGDHYKRIGAYFQADVLSGVEGMSLRVIGALGWTADEIRAFLVGVKKDLQDKSMIAYATMTVVYGRKPLLSAQE